MENTSNFILLYPHKIIKKNNIITANKNKCKINKNKNILIFVFILIFIFILIGVFILIFYLIYQIRKNESRNASKKLDLSSINNLFNFSLNYNEFNETINKQYIKFQNDFCKKNDKNVNKEIENTLKITNVNFNGINFDMYVYKGEDNFFFE